LPFTKPEEIVLCVSFQAVMNLKVLFHSGLRSKENTFSGISSSLPMKWRKYVELKVDYIEEQ